MAQNLKFYWLKNESTIGKNERICELDSCSTRVSLAHEYVYFEVLNDIL